jgi:methyl-accepting chemotaxis protein
VTQQNTANAEESASAAEELSSQAADLRRLLQGFHLKGGGVRQPQRAPSTPRLDAVTPKSSDWGGGNSEKTPQPSKQSTDSSSNNQDEMFIALDDDEFGRY